MEKEAALVGSHKNPNQLKNSMSELLLNALGVCFLLFACFVFKTFPVWSGEWYAPHLRCTFPVLLCVLEGRVSGAALMNTLVLWLTVGLNHGRHLE